MKNHLILRLFLVVHLAGFVTMAGATLIDYFTSRIFWKLAQQDAGKAFGLLPVMAGYGVIVRTGAIMLILSGVAMFIFAKGIWWQQQWFRLKIVLVLMLVLNGLFIGNRQGHRLRNIAYEGRSGFLLQTTGIRADLNKFYMTQLLLFFLILLVSVMKFDKSRNGTFHGILIPPFFRQYHRKS